MADEDVIVGEVEADPIETPANPIVDFLKSVEDKDLVSAEKQFNDLIGDRLQDAMDAAKVKIASSLYGDEPEEEEVEVEDEFEEEEVVDELDVEPEDSLDEPDDEEDAADENVAGV